MNRALGIVLAATLAATICDCGGPRSRVNAPTKTGTLLCSNGHPRATVMYETRDIIRYRAQMLFGVGSPEIVLLAHRPTCIDIELSRSKDKGADLGILMRRGGFVLGGYNLGASRKSQTFGRTPLAPGTHVRLIGMRVDVTHPNPTVVTIVVPASDIVPISASLAFTNVGSPVVNYSLDTAGSRAWCRYTTSHINDFSPVVLDGRVLIDPTIQAPICGGQSEVPGLSLSQAKGVEAYLNSGALPVALHRSH
jgi:preprotein translocase subunit SecD